MIVKMLHVLVQYIPTCLDNVLLFELLPSAEMFIVGFRYVLNSLYLDRYLLNALQKNIIDKYILKGGILQVLEVE